MMIQKFLSLFLTESHSGAKFDDDSYASVRGLNGIGSGATNCSSSWFRVVTKRDGYEWEMIFNDGIPQTKTAIRKNATSQTGTLIEFKPSAEVFSAEPIEFSMKQYVKK